jgi:hypothetical protein
LSGRVVPGANSAPSDPEIGWSVASLSAAAPRVGVDAEAGRAVSLPSLPGEKSVATVHA